MKLGKLAGLEKIELNQEKTELDKQIDNLISIIKNEEKQKEILIEKLSNFVKKFGDKRRTGVTHIEIKPEEKEIAEVVPEDCVVILTQNGDIKRVPLTSFKTQKRNGKGVKTEDNAILDTISTNTIDNLMLFTSEGKMFKLLVDNLPVGTNTSKGVKIETLINLEQNEKIVAMTSLHRKTNAEYVIFITKQGLIKKTCLEEYSKIKRSTGIAAIKLKEGDSLANVTFIKDEDMIVFTKNGMSIHFSTNDIAPIGRITSGVRAIKLNSDDEVVIGLPIHKNSDMVGVITSKGYGKKIALDEFPIQARGGKGVIVNKIESSGEIIGVCMIDNEDNLLLIGRPNSICFSAEELPLLSRGSLGNSLIKNSKVISVVKL
jgi:DNA gyrase subunit A